MLEYKHQVFKKSTRKERICFEVKIELKI